MNGSSAFTLKRMFCKAPAAMHAEKERGETDPKHKPDDQLPRALAHHHLENPRRIRAQRHANPELLRPLIDRETHHAVETDGRKNKSDHAEDAKELGHQPRSAQELRRANAPASRGSRSADSNRAARRPCSVRARDSPPIVRRVDAQRWCRIAAPDLPRAAAHRIRRYRPPD